VTYNPFAIDLWALGTVIAGFFLPDQLHNASMGEVEEQDEDVEPPRDTLFDSAYGDLGLAASIFRIRGTPNPETWPVS
jgi:hypothetical protein